MYHRCISFHNWSKINRVILKNCCSYGGIVFEHIIFLIKGSIVGFLMAAPVGPVGIFCIRRSLANGPVSGFFSGLGAATADAFYGLIAALGITFASSFLSEKQLYFQIAGTLFLWYFGTKIFFEPIHTKDAIHTRHSNLLGDYLSTFFVTLTNPLTILSFAAVFAGVGLAQVCGTYTSAAFLIAGVFLGSSTWWLTLSGSVGLLHKRITAHTINVINKISGALIVSFGIIIFINILMQLFCWTI